MLSRKKRIGAMLAAALLFAVTAWAAKTVYNFKGGVKTRADKGLTEADIAPAEPGGGFFTSTYTFMFYLDDDSSGMIQFTFWKLPILSRHAVAVSYIDETGKHHLRKPVFDNKEFNYTADPREFRLGPNYWKGDYPDFYLHMDFPAEEGLEALKLDLHYHCRTPGWRPGEGPTHYGEPDGAWYDLIALIPWADLSGTITLGGRERKVAGFGYADHNTQTVLPTTQLGEILALRSFSKDYSVTFLEYIAPADYGKTRTTWIMVMKGDRILYATDDWERELGDFATSDKYGYKYPKKLVVNIDRPGCKLSGVVKGVRFNEMIDAMEELPSFVRPIADKFFEAPLIIRQNAVVEWHLVMPEKGLDEKFINKGIFETTLVR